MVLNPYFTQGTSSEQNLVQDLVNEQLRTYGVEIFYLPRKFATEKSVIREVVQSKFDVAYPLEAYVDNYDEYSGGGNLLSKFGIQSQDEVRLIISRERFENYITPLIQNQDDIKLSTRPKSGDLIWFPLDDRVYEIKDIEYAKPYYQLQDLYVYELYCELFRYEDEVIDTGIDEIDNELVGDDYDGTTDDGLNTIIGPTQTLTLVGSASTAWAYTGIVTSGGIRKVVIANRGGGYIYPPNVGFGSAPSTGVTGIGSVHEMLGGMTVCNKNIANNMKSVQSIVIVNPGAGYTVAPGMAVTAVANSGGSGFIGTVHIGDGTLGVVTVTDGGGGFSTTTPTVTFNTPLSFTNTGIGTTATGVAVVVAVDVASIAA